MGRPAQYGERVSTGLRLPPELHERVLAEASRRDLSWNRLVELCIAGHLPLMEQAVLDWCPPGRPPSVGTVDPLPAPRQRVPRT